VANSSLKNKGARGKTKIYEGVNLTGKGKGNRWRKLEKDRKAVAKKKYAETMDSWGTYPIIEGGIQGWRRLRNLVPEVKEEEYT